jgi:hypothetical protein
MPKYQCHFLDESKRVVRVEPLGHCGDDSEAHHEALILLTRAGHFTGYELWQDGRMIGVYPPIKLEAAL